MNPALLLAVILATLYGAAFHIWQGGSPRRLLLYLLASWMGFALGQGIAAWLGVTLGRVGPLNVLTATLGSWIALGATRVLVASEAMFRK